MTIVYYVTIIRGRQYPVQSRFGGYAYAHELQTVYGKKTTKYLGIQKVPYGHRVLRKCGRTGGEYIPTDDTRRQPIYNLKKVVKKIRNGS